MKGLSIINSFSEDIDLLLLPELQIHVLAFAVDLQFLTIAYCDAVVKWVVGKRGILMSNSFGGTLGRAPRYMPRHMQVMGVWCKLL